jgi:hypothetical protein
MGDHELALNERRVRRDLLRRDDASIARVTRQGVADQSFVPAGVPTTSTRGGALPGIISLTQPVFETVDLCAAVQTLDPAGATRV